MRDLLIERGFERERLTTNARENTEERWLREKVIETETETVCINGSFNSTNYLFFVFFITV